jgi:hypothetical protein
MPSSHPETIFVRGQAEPVAPQSRTETTAADMKQGPATTPTDGHKSVGTVIKDTFTSAPWSDTHDKTLEALTHAKVAHAKAMQAQASLKAASESKNKADLAQRHAQEVWNPNVHTMIQRYCTTSSPA